MADTVTNTRTDRLQRIEDALDAVLGAIVDQIVNEPPNRRAGLRFNVVSLSDIEHSDDTDVSELIRDPVGASLRASLVALGQRVYDETKSTDTMRDVLARVAERDTHHAGLRGSLMDTWWEGIGSGEDRWWH